MSIQSIRHKGLKRLFVSGDASKIGSKYADKALVILDYLDAIVDLKDCEGFKDFHPLKGNRKGEYSMHVNGNYVITFRWDGHDVHDVNFEDCH